jgi:hypothetical protein
MSLLVVLIPCPVAVAVKVISRVSEYGPVPESPPPEEIVSSPGPGPVIEWLLMGVVIAPRVFVELQKLSEL